MSPIIDLDDEGFDRFFENVDELMKTSVSGFSGSGIGSSSQTFFTPEEIAQAKETLKSALGLDFIAIFGSDQLFNLRRSMDILVKSQAKARGAEPTIQSFLKELPGLSKSYEIATKDLSTMKSQLDTMDSIHQALQEKSNLWSQLRNDHQNVKQECTTLTSSIESFNSQIATLEAQKKEAKDKLADLSKREASLDQPKQELLKDSKDSQAKLEPLAAERSSILALKEKAENTISSLMTAWDTLKTSISDEFDTPPGF